MGASAAALSATVLPAPLQAATQCVTGILPGFQPTSLSVNCASKRNFRAFRRRPDALGLTGVVSMSFVSGSQGTYSAGSLFLFPWCKGATKSFPAAVPLNVNQFVNITPIPDATLPLDEYFLRFVLQVPWTSFIGFQVDVPYSASDAPRDWCSNVDNIGDGSGVGIDWTSQNLNGPWFAGSNWIPATDTCGGNAWRNVIVAALGQTAVGVC
ncbi:MAG TPA: hypothetical protein VGG01_09660 [Xanthobacteraceae bacterium]